MWCVLLASAFAADTYVNGTVVDPRLMADVRLERVTVWFDAIGNIHVDAPGYQVEVLGPTAVAGTTLTSATSSRAASAAVGAQAASAAAASAAPPVGSGVVPARWFIVSEDSGSGGHSIEVWINGQLATTVHSGDPQAIVDVARWLHVGTNEIEIRSNSAHATGGNLYVYVGTGSDRSGTFVMDEPPVEFGLASDRLGFYSRTYKLIVDR